MEILIRHAVADDLAAVVRLLYEVQEVHAQGRPDLFIRGSRKYSDDEVLRIFSDGQRPVLVAERNHEVVGYAFCIFEQTPPSAAQWPLKTLYIDDLCVDAACRGQHIGTELYKAVLALAKEHGCDRVTLNVWSLNQNAMQFYRKCGLHELKVTMEQKL